MRSYRNSVSRREYRDKEATTLFLRVLREKFVFHAGNAGSAEKGCYNSAPPRSPREIITIGLEASTKNQHMLPANNTPATTNMGVSKL